jgi:hypothetical protein
MRGAPYSRMERISDQYIYIYISFYFILKCARFKDVVERLLAFSVTDPAFIT